MPGSALSSTLAMAIVATVRQPLLVLAEDLRVVSANPAFYRQFLTEPESTIDVPLWELGNGQWDIPLLRGLLEDILEEHGVVEGFEVSHDFERLGHREFVLNARQVVLEQQQFRLVLVAFEDVTEQRAAQRAMQESAVQLRRSNRDLEEFAHAASHDLQEPLRKVRTFADRFVRSVDRASLSEQQQQFLERMHDAAGRMQTRIDDLLKLARITRVSPRRQVIAVEDVLKGVLRDLDTAIAAEGAVVDVGPLPDLEADPTLLALLLQNLVSNALKYRRPDVPPRIRIRSADVLDRTGRPAAEITVTDNGIGFDPEYAERIFLPFERLHGSAEYEGSGVGLAISMRVAEAHGGTIHADGAPGRGATFTVVLPRGTE